jgi:hypothetical protein
MVRYRRQESRISLRHRLSAAVALFAYLSAAVGYPIPTSAVARKDRSQPFPCQEHACGCQSAEECWSGCCCFTPEERWAWASEHNVQPPAYAEKPVAQGWQTTRLRDAEEHAADSHNCCEHDHKSVHSCCSESRVSEKCASCAEPTAAKDTSAATPETDQHAEVRWVLGVSALRCKAVNLLWVSNGAVLLPGPCEARHSYPICTDRLKTHELVGPRLNQSPPSRPPRSFSV